MNSTKGPTGTLLCIENPIYRRYLEHELAAMGTSFRSVDTEELATVIAESPNGLLLLQSESFEYGLIDLSARLKRIFGDEIRVLLLSSDYRTGEDAGHSVDAFLQHPASIGEVLDAFCYTGGFAMHAARAGGRVVGLEVSAEALAAAEAHARLNGLADRCVFQEVNAFDALRALAREGPRFDMVILDPPAFAKSKAALPKAAAGYKEIKDRKSVV